MIRLSTVSISIVVFLLLTACGDDRTVTVYSLKKVDPKTNYGHEWLPLNPTTYRVGENKVVAKTAGILTEYHKCMILSSKDWECSYSDGSGKFGFRNGEFWELPVWDGVKHVSRLKYNLNRCDWAINDNEEGYFWGAVRCVAGWE